MKNIADELRMDDFTTYDLRLTTYDLRLTTLKTYAFRISKQTEEKNFRKDPADPACCMDAWVYYILDVRG